MTRILTGIQSSGVPHLGNILGAILPAIELSKKPQYESFFFIADLHSLTSLKDKKLIDENTLSVAAAWLACGFDADRNIFYRQSKIPEVCELMWYLNCFTPYPMLANAHSFKDKSSKLSDVNVGLFAYPVLMAADILLYNANLVPVGKDQKQHLEITRNIAHSINYLYEDTLVVPNMLIANEQKLIPGTDGQKMSKSYQNTINIFQSNKQLKKDIMKIITDSTPLEETKDPKTCNVFALYKAIANQDEIQNMSKKYLDGGFGFGDAKQAFFKKICDRFKEERKNYGLLMNTPEMIEEKLETGEKKARKIAQETLNRVKSKLGYL